MSYRHDAHEHQHVDGVPTHTKLRLLNGTTPELVLTCNYDEDGVLTPIHLTTEGYDTYEVAFEPVVTGLSATAAIDPVDDSIIRVVFVIECASAAAEDVETSFSVLASRGANATLRTDCVLRGTLEIEDAPLPIVAVPQS
jgi:hypothetical protein